MQRRGAGGAAPLAVIAFISLVSLLFVVLLQQLDSLPWDAAEFRSVLSVDEVDETQVISYIEPLPATRLDECLCHVRVDPPALPLGNGTGEWDTTVGPAVVVSLAALSTLASDSELSLEAATASALYGLCEGGVRSVYLVPGMGSHWTTRNIGAVAAAVAATRDLHGEPLPVSFVAVPPAAVQCAGVGDERMGVAAALAAGAPAVLLASHVSALKRRALFFEPALPRFLPQAQASPAPVPLRRHFLTCGGGEAPCMPPPDAPRLCSTWVRPLVQVGLCHPASLYSHGRHTTAAANSPGDPAVFPGPARLLEEVTPVVLRPGAALPLAGLREAPGSDSSSGGSGGPAEKSAVLDSPAAGTRPARAYAYNVLADRSAAWLLGAGFSAGGSPGVDVALHAALGWLGGNLTVLPPGRLCNVSSSWERVPAGVRDQDSADVALSAAADAAHAALLKLPALLPGNISADTIVVTARAALRATAAAGSVSALELADVERWLDVYAAAILHHKRQGGSPKHGLCADAVLRGAAVGAAASNGTARVTADMPALRPEARDALAHCFVDHHNVRDILLVMNFNDWGEWAPVNIKLQIELLGNFYPGIVTYTSKNYEPSVVAGIPALNLDYCEGGAGHHIGLKAQKCTGMALLRYPGHLGYVVSNDDVMLSTWLTLAYRTDWLWHKTKKPNHDYYYNCTANSQCYNCWSWSGLYGPIRFFRMHHLLRPWMLDIKMANFNRSDGCSCSMVDAFYVPGVLAHAFGYLSMTSYYANAEVELATSTIYDTVALRSEREHLRNVFDGKHALTKYDPLLHDWAHSFKYSKPEPRERARAVAARAAADGWFYRPNITALRLRPFVYEHS